MLRRNGEILFKKTRGKQGKIFSWLSSLNMKSAHIGNMILHELIQEYSKNKEKNDPIFMKISSLKKQQKELEDISKKNKKQEIELKKIKNEIKNLRSTLTFLDISMSKINEIINELKKKPYTFIENGEEYHNYLHDYPANAAQQCGKKIAESIRSFFGKLKSGDTRVRFPSYNRKRRKTAIFSKVDFSVVYSTSKENVTKKKFLSRKDLSKMTANQKNKLYSAAVIGEKFNKNRFVFPLEKGIFFVNELQIIPSENGQSISVKYIYNKDEQNWALHDISTSVEKEIESSDEFTLLKKLRKQRRFQNKQNKLNKIKNTKEESERFKSTLKQLEDKKSKLIEERKLKINERIANKKFVHRGYFSEKKRTKSYAAKNLASIDAGAANIVTMSILSIEENKASHFSFSKDEKEMKKLNHLYKVSENFSRRIDEQINKKISSDEELSKDQSNVENKRSVRFIRNVINKMSDAEKNQHEYLLKCKREIGDKINRLKREIEHKLSSKIAKILVKNNVKLLVCGKNENMKQEMKGVKMWQQFAHARLFSKLQYKLEEIKIDFSTIDESYTSKSSYFLNEPFDHGFKYQGIRNRRHFSFQQNNQKIIINADFHAALNILRKHYLLNNIKFPVDAKSTVFDAGCATRISFS